MAVLVTGRMSELTQGDRCIQSFFRASLEPNSRQIAEPEEFKAHDRDTSISHTTKAHRSNDDGVGDEQGSSDAMRGVSKIVVRKNLSQKTMFDMQEVDLNHARRKRCKTSSKDFEFCDVSVKSATAVLESGAPDSSVAQSPDHMGARSQEPHGGHYASINLPQHHGIQSDDLSLSSAATDSTFQVHALPSLEAESMIVPKSSAECSSSETAQTEPSKARKVLQLNFKTGTIGSPPRRKLGKLKPEENAVVTPRKRRGRSRNVIVSIKYGTDRHSRDAIGERIEALMAHKSQDIPAGKVDKAATIQSSDHGSLKSTHPFFLGQPSSRLPGSEAGTSRTPEHTAQTANANLPMRETLAKTGPGKPVRAAHPLATPAVTPHYFGLATRMTITPGAVDPPWPPKGMVHVRDCEFGISQVSRVLRNDDSGGYRKHKHSAGDVVAAEDVLARRFQSLHIIELKDELMSVDDEDFAAPAPCLRLPIKHFHSGIWLQQRLDHELKTASPVSDHTDTDTDELSSAAVLPVTIHPAIKKTYGLLAVSSSAFDRSQMEASLWCEKYAPVEAGEVLQNGQESSILKNWLKALTVKAVETGMDEVRSREISNATKKATALASKQSKRKRKSKLEGFIVSSDEEGDTMDDILLSDGVSPHGSQECGRSVVRTEPLSKTGKLTNTIAISGPHGCGKTAMVYAAAKELGFEVFEINASSRRSGKDVLERVGDMTKNHLVYAGTKHGPVATADDLIETNALLPEDPASGRQSQLNAFFKSQSSTLKGKGNKRSLATKEVPKSKSTPKTQKQSLILLEEVDILYAEDKQFWATVVDLIIQSKRPVILTCNEESVVPLQTLDLHAILRLNHPPTDLATNYMLLVAANEGHILERTAVENLYKGRNLDLRGSLQELQFWCQMGIGDRKGGMEWFYPRWPPGSDLDDHGNTIRIISENTYRTGMGWLSHDLLDSAPLDQIRTEVVKTMWREAQLDMDNDEGLTVPPSTTTDAYEGTAKEGCSDELTTTTYQQLSETMSAADLCASGQLNQASRVALDTTSPKLSLKARDDYIIGYEFLQADEMVHYDLLATDISVWLQASSRPVPFEVPEGRAMQKDMEGQLIQSMSGRYTKARAHLTRKDLSLAFDPISAPEHVYPPTATSLDCSVFDRTVALITTDVAPYVRSIVASDLQLQAERAKLNGLLNEGGRTGKRMRTTRAALSALEGGARISTRKDKYFDAALDYAAVRRTGGTGWESAAKEELARRVEDAEVQGVSTASSLDEADMP